MYSLRLLFPFLAGCFPADPFPGGTGADDSDAGVQESGLDDTDSGDTAGGDSGQADSANDTGDSALDTGDSANDTGDSALDTGDSGGHTGDVDSAGDTGDSALDTATDSGGGDTAADTGGDDSAGDTAADTGSDDSASDTAADSSDSAADSGDSASDSGDSAVETGDTGAEAGDSGLDTSGTETGSDTDTATEPDTGVVDTGPEDVDGDGYAVGDDCDDGDASVFPSAAEVCEDAVDNDCVDGDAGCRFAGSYGLSGAAAKRYSSDAGYDAGRHVDAGDIDCDGIDDMLVATKEADGNEGGAYVAYGPFTGTATLDSAAFRIRGDSSTTSAGRSIGVGDVNGDGCDDVGIGAPDATGQAWIVFGPVAGSMDLVDADVNFVGWADTEAGHGMDLADIDDDGVSDAILGAYEDDSGGTDAGAIFIHYGTIWGGTVDMPSDADARLLGENDYAYAGRYLRAGVDVDGDGLGDILAAAPYATGMASRAGAAYLVSGDLRGDVDLSSADGKFLGEAADDNASEGIAMGDFDGDGLGDIVLGSYNGYGGYNAGAAYVVLGPASGTHDLAAADFIVRGTSASAYVGIGLAIGDIDHDGNGELAIGAPGDSTAGISSGAAYLFYGPPSGTLTLASNDAAFFGENLYHNAGESIVTGDLDGDGWGDLLIGTPGEYTGGANAGAVYVVSP